MLFGEYGYIWHQLLLFKRLVIISLAVSLLAALFEGANIGLLVVLLQNITTPDAAPLQTGISGFDLWILGVDRAPFERLVRAVTLILLCSWLRSIFNYLSAIYTELTQLRLVDRLRKLLFEQYQALSLTYFAQQKTGDLLSVVIAETGRISQIMQGVFALITRFLNVLTYLGSLFLLSWQLSLVSFVFFGGIAVGLAALNRWMREASFAVPKTSAVMSSVVLEFLTGVRTIQAFATQERERRRYYAASEGMMMAQHRLTRLSNATKPMAEALSTAVLVGMILISFSGAGGAVSSPALLTFFFVLLRMLPNVQDMIGTVTRLSALRGTLDVITAMLSPEGKPYYPDGTMEFPGLQGSIHFESVSFSYGGDQMVLYELDLTIEKGKMTALVGASGAGKSTVVDLLARFYDPNQGAIFVNGTDLREFRVASWRRQMAIVSQDTFIFNLSVQENIVYGTEGASFEQVHRAALAANALGFIEELPEGFETLLGDRGVRLSGGQRQRLAIARALLRNPELLILDEATSALDSVSERLIQQSLEQLAEGRTVVAIAHRLSTIMKADRVVVLEKGRIVEQGCYGELIDRRGKLWEYHQMQFASNGTES
ncbi:MAG: ABC transporter ATP-binding protein [Oscillatoriales cyanobacterium SM2_2_1]|nr:ABC transporter ATP-binding protein [Oscillatoriales cyanobacterium SM2_2_1]